MEIKISNISVKINGNLIFSNLSYIMNSREFYDMLSKLEVTMATPTLANARKPFHQLSSCFIGTKNVQACFYPHPS